jgi:hypothetical protein
VQKGEDRADWCERASGQVMPQVFHKVFLPWSQESDVS